MPSTREELEGEAALDEGRHERIARALILDAARHLGSGPTSDADRPCLAGLAHDSPLVQAAIELVALTEAALAHERSQASGDREAGNSQPVEEGLGEPAGHELGASDAIDDPNEVMQPPNSESATALADDQADAAESRGTTRTPVTFAVSANARVGEAFQARLVPLGGVDEQSVCILDCAIPAGLGLVYEARGHRISGTPASAGDFSLTVHYRHEDAPDEPVQTGSARLTVNHDPRSLWQEWPSDTEAPGWKPDCASELQSSAGDRRVVAASKRGRAHAHIGGFRDDDYCLIGARNHSWTLIAVADGAGSAVRARTGSQLAASVAARLAADELAGEPGQALTGWTDAGDEKAPRGLQPLRRLAYEALGRAALGAVKAIEEDADQQGLSPKDYATTLLLVAHRPLADSHLLISFWVGDGAIAALHPSGVQLLGAPDSGAFAGQTRFLDRSVIGDGNEIMARIGVARIPELTALFVMTDGVSDAYFDSDQALAQPPAWLGLWEQIRPLLATPEPAEALLGWLDFWSPGNHDDRTIAVLW